MEARVWSPWASGTVSGAGSGAVWLPLDTTVSAIPSPGSSEGPGQRRAPGAKAESSSPISGAVSTSGAGGPLPGSSLGWTSSLD